MHSTIVASSSQFFTLIINVHLNATLKKLSCWWVGYAGGLSSVSFNIKGHSFINASWSPPASFFSATSAAMVELMSNIIGGKLSKEWTFFIILYYVLYLQNGSVYVFFFSCTHKSYVITTGGSYEKDMHDFSR